MEGSTRGSGGDGSKSGQVVGVTLAELDGGGSVVLGGVGDGVGLSRLEGLGHVVELDGEDGRDEGGARDDNFEETHVDCGVVGKVRLGGIRVLRWVYIKASRYG